MRNNEFRLLVEEWNKFLIKEEKIFLLEEELIRRDLINESLMKKLRSMGIKRSVIVPILLMKFLSINSAHAHDHNHNHSQHSYEEVHNAAEEKGIDPPSHDDFLKACKVVDSENFVGFNEGDVKEEQSIFESIFREENRQVINKLFLKSFNEGSENIENKNIVKLFPGMYTKVTADCLSPDHRNSVTKEIYDALAKASKKGNETIKVNITSKFDLLVGLMDKEKLKKYSKQITEIFFKDKIKVEKNNKELPLLKQKILDKIEDVIFQKIKNSHATGLTFPYNYFTSFFNQALNDIIQNENLEGVSIQIENINSGEHGGLILLSYTSTEAVIEHELGHVLSMNVDDVSNTTNNAYYKFVRVMHHYKKKTFTLEDVTNFLLQITKSKIPIEISDLNDLNEQGQEKLVENARLLINIMIGGGGIEPLEGDKFKLLIEPTYWDSYLHSQEERIETLRVFLTNHCKVNGKISKDKAIELFSNVKDIITKNKVKLPETNKKGKKVLKTYDIAVYSELQHEINNELKLENEVGMDILSFFGYARRSGKKYNQKYAMGQIDNLIKLLEYNNFN
jgi:hypothetical protein